MIVYNVTNKDFATRDRGETADCGDSTMSIECSGDFNVDADGDCGADSGDGRD